MSTPTAVIIGDHTQGLGILRSAAAAGVPTWVVNDKFISLARFSRYLAGYRQLPHGTLSKVAETAYARSLRAALLEIPFEGPGALFGVNEDITSFIHENRNALRAKYLIPELPFESICDKYAFNSLLPDPVQLDTSLCSEIDLGAIASPQLFILKGRSGSGFRHITGQKALRLDLVGPRELDYLFAKLPRDQVILQEIIETSRPVVSVCSFSIDGVVAGHFGYEKLRQHPNCFGTGTYLRSISVNQHICVAKDILRTLGFTGISEIEFIHDLHTDSYKVVEMNPRTWKSIHFATQCGQNLVAAHLSYIAGRGTKWNGDYAKDQYWVDLATDIPQMFRERKPCRYKRGLWECTWNRSDPLPAFVLWTLFPLIALESSLLRFSGRSNVGLRVGPDGRQRPINLAGWH
jgi:predicted ATP-grasp superfamily ATP-dependent carboligase